MAIYFIKKNELLLFVGIQFFVNNIYTTHDFIKSYVKEYIPSTFHEVKKPITVLLYGSARNDLLPFIDRNLQQLMQIGSNQNINFLVHLDTFDKTIKTLTQRFIIKKYGMTQIGDNMSMDSGSTETLIDACRWAFTQFPSTMTILILWNHGTGDLEPLNGRAFNPIQLFRYNQETNMIELNRSIHYLDYITKLNESKKMRGICFDEITGHYLTNKQVGEALSIVRDTYLQGNPIDILCCDACLMQGIGFFYSLKQYKQKPVAHIVLGSQEVVLATGYPYDKLFAQLAEKMVTREEFAQHVVYAFEAMYSKITNDYTQSAVCLDEIDVLYEAIHGLSTLLIKGLKKSHWLTFKKFIQKSIAYKYCTHFEEPTYKDLNHLIKNMLDNIDMIISIDNETELLKHEISIHLEKIKDAIHKVVIANVAGKNLLKSSGISIYFPEKKIDPSYKTTLFAENNAWFALISTYVKINIPKNFLYN